MKYKYQILVVRHTANNSVETSKKVGVYLIIAESEERAIDEVRQEYGFYDSWCDDLNTYIFYVPYIIKAQKVEKDDELEKYKQMSIFEDYND